MKLVFSSDQIPKFSVAPFILIPGKHRGVSCCFQALSSFACSPLNSSLQPQGGGGRWVLVSDGTIGVFCGIRRNLSWWEADLAPIQGFAHQGKGAGGED